MKRNRAELIPPFIVMEVLERAQELEHKGHDIIHMEIGEPDFDTPYKIRQAAINAIQRNETHYTHSLGILPLRKAICAHYIQKYNVSIDPDQILVTQGTSPALLLTLCALLNPNDEIIISDPCYACYPNFIRYIDGIPKVIPVSAECGFIMQPEKVKEAITERTKAILINSPSNPTGTLIPPENMQALAEFGLPIISDEIYHGLVYGEKEHSILEFTDNAFVLNGFSKYYAMTGFRLGYIITPKKFIRPLQKSQQNLFICASSISQWAGVSALEDEHPEIPQMVITYNERRKFVLENLQQLGFKIATEPKGAFYVLADAREFCSNSYKFAFDLLEKAHVAVDPGIDFGENAEGFIRFSYANSIEKLTIGFERIKQYLLDII